MNSDREFFKFKKKKEGVEPNQKSGRILSENPLHIKMADEADRKVEYSEADLAYEDSSALKEGMSESPLRIMGKVKEDFENENSSLSAVVKKFRREMMKEQLNDDSENILEDSMLQRERYKKEHNQMYLEFVVDGTISFAEIFVPVYRAIESSVFEIEKIAVENDINTKYGLTILGDRLKTVSYGASEYYTDKKDIFLKSVRDIQFAGGNLSGHEDIDNAIENALRKLENNSPERANRAILVFTDSSPVNEDEDVNFRNISDCPNNGIRFAMIYLGNSEYYGYFKLVDRNGEETEDGKNTYTEVRSISELLGVDSDKSVRDLVSRLVYQTSVR